MITSGLVAVSRIAARAVWMALLLVASGCGPASGEHAAGDTARSPAGASRGEGGASRSFGASIDTVWSIEGARAESLLTEAHFIAAGGGRVYVADATHGIVAFDADGRSLWSAALPAVEGPSVTSVGALVVLNERLLVVADRGTGTIRHLTRDGRFTGAHRLDEQWTLHSLCALSDSTLLLTSGDAPLGVVALDGRTLRHAELPWPGLRDADRMLQQSVVASAPDGEGCVVAQSIGGAFAFTPNGERFDTASYVEQRPLPKIIVHVDTVPDGVVTSRAMPPDHAPTAERAAIAGGRIYIAYGGDVPSRDGLVDVYDRPSLAYRASLRLGVPVRALAASGDTLYVLHDASGETGLLGLRVSLRAP